MDNTNDMVLETVKNTIKELNKDELEIFMEKLKNNGYPEEILDEILNDIGETNIKDTKKQIFNQPQKPNSLYDFTIENVSEEEILRGCIESDVPVFLHGLTGDGKSARVKQIDKDPVIIYLRNATPESLNGKSAYDPKTGEIELKPNWLKKLENKCAKEPDKLHVLFFDELSNALPSLQGMAFNIILDKEVNGVWKLPENSRIVAAGNEMEESLSANQLAAPLFSRFAHIYIETNLEGWLKWALENNIHPAICAYMKYTQGHNLRTEFTGEEPNADPRKWQMASKILYNTNNPEMLRALVGEEVTDEFVEFCSKKVVTIDDVLNKRYEKVTLKLDEKYLTTAGLSWVDEEHYSEVRNFVKEKLGSEMCTLFDSFWARDDEDRLEKVAEEKLRDKIKQL